MADEFQTFSKAPIVGVVNIKHWSFAVREIILAVVALLLLMMCLIFVGLYAKSHSDTSTPENVHTSSALVQKTLCVNKECMEIGAHSLTLMNLTVDPCDNFYEYACGNYVTYNPFGTRGYRTVVDDMKQENIDRLEEIIHKPPSRSVEWSYERKLSHFFMACSNLYQREKLLGHPLLDKVIPALGGWDVLGTFNANTWNLNNAIKKVQVEFWVDAFFTPAVEYVSDTPTKRIITIAPAGMGKYMYPSWYSSRYAVKKRQDYKKFMRRVATLLLRDANVTNMSDEVRDNKIDQFVNDTFWVESGLANALRRSRLNISAYDVENRITLGQLSRDTTFIMWTQIISHLFNEANVNDNTKVVLLHRTYFRELISFVRSLPAAFRKRILHNYLVWRVTEAYVQDLSWEYIHANREVYVALRGRARFLGVTNFCMYMTEMYMRDGLGALYVQEHFADESKQKVTDITLNLKKALQSQLDNTPWMDATTKSYAKRKLDSVTFKLGFPDWMRNVDYIDNIYSSLSINVSDYFGSLLSANQFMRREWNRELSTGSDRREWIYEPYDTRVSTYYHWNEVIATAGILREPIFNHRAPHYVTFGSLGTKLAKFLHYIVDEYGSYYSNSGSHMENGGWWTNSSKNAYRPVKQCVIDNYANVTQNFTTRERTVAAIPINNMLFAPTAIANTNGIRVALKGYEDWMSTRGGSEKILPGLSLTQKQTFFLSYAQSQCFNRRNWNRLLMVFRGQVEEDIQVNMALGELQEFSDAFQCKAGSPMNHKKKCDYY